MNVCAEMRKFILRRVKIMTKYREILRLKGLGFSERNIALSVPCSRNTVSKVLKCAEECGISWPLSDSTTDGNLEKLLSPSAPAVSSKRMPDFAYIRKELLKNGGSRKLLWTEYIEDCRQAGDEPLMFTVLLLHPAGRKQTPCHHAYQSQTCGAGGS